PTHRPKGAPAGTQSWRELLFVHWSFTPDVVRPLVPPSLELDEWEGRAWVGLVPFQMLAIRSRWMPRASALNFLETNVRTYVHRKGEPGVFFLSLEASSWLAVRTARAVWSLPYHFASMRYTRDGDRIHYDSTRKESSTRGARLDVSWTVGDALGPS